MIIVSLTHIWVALHGHAASAFGSLSQVVFSPAMVLRRMVQHIREEGVKDGVGVKDWKCIGPCDQPKIENMLFDVWKKQYVPIEPRMERANAQ